MRRWRIVMHRRRGHGRALLNQDGELFRAERRMGTPAGRLHRLARYEDVLWI